LALGIGILSGSSAMAQGNVGAGASGGVFGAGGGGSASAGIGGGLMGGGMGGLNAVPGSSGVGPGYGAYGTTPGAYGAPYLGAGYVGAGYGGNGLGCYDFGLGYPYTRGHGLGCHYPHGYALRQLSFRNWCSDVLGKECLDPYFADPYGPPPVGFGYPPAYMAPTLNAANTTAESR
jgi:hypothetical protein